MPHLLIFRALVAQHALAWVRCCSSGQTPCSRTLCSPSFCFLLFIVLDPASRPCANASLPAKLNLFQGRLHKSPVVLLGARHAGLAALSSWPQPCPRTCWHRSHHSAVSRMPHGLWEEQQSPTEIMNRLCKFEEEKKRGHQEWQKFLWVDSLSVQAVLTAGSSSSSP